MYRALHVCTICHLITHIVDYCIHHIIITILQNLPVLKNTIHAVHQYIEQDCLLQQCTISLYIPVYKHHHCTTEHIYIYNYYIIYMMIDGQSVSRLTALCSCMPSARSPWRIGLYREEMVGRTMPFSRTRPAQNTYVWHAQCSESQHRFTVQEIKDGLNQWSYSYEILLRSEAHRPR